LADYNLTSLLKDYEPFPREPGWKKLRKLNVVIEYPIAHAQTQNMIYNDWEMVEKIQTGFPRLIMSAATQQGRQELAAMGYELSRLIVFDGLPQAFPTETGGDELAILRLNSEENFLNQSGYPGWKPEYGSACRGPLPPNSKLTYVNSLSAQTFAELGLDMRWYGRIWEFANQFWWGLKMWEGKGGKLDCTHSSDGHYMYRIHKYFLQAMADDEVASNMHQRS